MKAELLIQLINALSTLAYPWPADAEPSTPVYPCPVEAEPSASAKRMIGEDVIVRCRDAGVHFGQLFDYAGREVVLRDSRRMWYWKAKSGHTLSACATVGIDHGASKITDQVDEIVLLEACEIISCATDAARSLRDAPIYQPG